MSLILKCKMCGGDIEVNQDMTIGVCQYCGSHVTLPKVDDEKKARLFNIANQYRLKNEFDRAYETYKDIVKEDEQEAEAYWGMLLSLYGVEYVEDPITKKRIPTCHRTISQSIKNTADYENVCKYADIERKILYREEADLIDSIQKKIMAVSSKEDPYDVFICYKESDDNTGERTKDSLLAYTIYENLEKRGMRTFFSRVSLEDKLGQDYEPYIYAALRSAKVMLLVTTSSEHAESVWVKNEWKRFLSFIDEKEEKIIIPVFEDMTAYELPSELAKYQSQDMSKVGAIQDLMHAVEKVIKNETKVKELSTADVIVTTMLKRGEEALRTQNWEKATSCYENVLDYKADNLDAYIGLLLAEKKCQTLDELKLSKEKLENSQYYDFIIKNCDLKQKKKFKSIEKNIISNINQQNKKIIKRICIGSFAAIFTILCYVIITNFVNNVVKPYRTYNEACNQMEQGYYEEAYDKYVSLDTYRDSYQKKVDCVYYLELQSISENKYDCKYFQYCINDFSNEQIYNIAMEYYDIEYYEKVIDMLSSYSNKNNECIDLLNKAYCKYALRYAEADFNKALSLLSNVSDEEKYEDGRNEVLETVYQKAVDYLNNEQYKVARDTFKTLSSFEYMDVEDKIRECEEYINVQENAIESINNTKKNAVGTWYSSNSWPWGCTIKISQGYNITYCLGKDTGREWSSMGSLVYNDNLNQYTFKWVSEEYTATINGDKMIVKGKYGDEPYFIGTFTRQ